MITMAHLHGKKGSLPRKGKHWSLRVRETIVLRSSDGSFNLKIDGGAENGEFIIIGGIKENKVKYKKGKLLCDDVVLEINDQPVAGYTRPDVLTLINKNGGDAVWMRTVKPGHGITRDLREYLGARFEKNTIDNDLQQTIRENLYRRTVPCTTRGPRNGEIPNVDYVFLTMEEFQRMERSGALLESGIYDGNHYGTPKPPKLPVGTLTRKQQQQPASVKKKNQRSQESLPDYNDRTSDFPGPLPSNWEIAYTESNEKYFINHETGTTQWMDPRLASSKKARPEDCSDDELPYGWERVDDPNYGTYYIDHEARKTQFENPITASRRHHNTIQNSYYEGDHPAPYRVPPSFSSASAQAKAQEAEARSRWPQMNFDHSQPPAYNHMDYNKKVYNISGRQLEGEMIKTTLLKGSRGFGFTIIGGDEPGELLQIKSIVPDGAAAKDGKLRTGDALVRLNGQPVVSKTHQEVVTIFQSMPMNEGVELEMIRGYPLPFDPDDPNVETIGSYTVVRSPSERAESPSYNQGGYLQPGTRFKSVSDQSLTSSNASGGGRGNRTGDSPTSIKTSGMGTFPRTSTSSTMAKSAPEIHNIRVLKGPMGFGFKLADSPYGQKVKQILDASRCAELQEGDILLEINNKEIRNYKHKQTVAILQKCTMGQEALLVIQRGVSTPLKNSPVTGRREEELQSFGRKARPKSTPPMGYNDQNERHTSQSSDRAGSWGNLATSGESTRHQDTGYGYRDSQNHPSLKRGMGVRSSQEYLNGPSDDCDTFTVNIRKGSMGFGFRVIGGNEEGTQVSVGTVVPGSPADTDARLQVHDEIIRVNDQNVIGSSHHHVIALIHESANTGRVSLGIRRRRPLSGRSTPVRRPFGNSQVRVSSRSAGDLTVFGVGNGRELGFQPPRESHGRDRRRSESDRNEPDVSMDFRHVTLTKNESEGFGFVILSSVRENGSTIGRIIQGSPADRCRQLSVGDRLVAVNGSSIAGMHHSEIVDTIKQSGTLVTLTISQKPLENGENRMPYKSAPNINRIADGYRSDREDYRRNSQRSFNRQREEEEALERERERREREEKRVQEERRRKEEEREARRIETERKEVEKREEELRRQEQLRRDEEIRREEERKRDEDRKWREEKKREDEKRWTQERAEDNRWDKEQRRQSDSRRFEEERRVAERMRYNDRKEEERRRDEEAKRQERKWEERKREEEFRRQDAIRKREEEEKLQQELRRRNEEIRRHEDETRKQEEIRRSLEEEARRQEEQRRRDEEQVKQHVQEIQVRPNQTVKKAPPPVMPKPSKAKVQQAREERNTSRYGTMPARPAGQDTRYRRFSGGDIYPEPPVRSYNSRGKSESDLAQAFRGIDDPDIFEVELHRKNQGYGFSIRGGREFNMPIFVLKIAEGGVAAVDGRIKAGDEILEINERSTKDLLHTDAIGMIRGSNRVHLTLRRNLRTPPVFDDLPNGGPNRSLSRNHERPSSGSYEHSRSLYY